MCVLVRHRDLKEIDGRKALDLDEFGFQRTIRFADQAEVRLQE
jgi:hypothetical protein